MADYMGSGNSADKPEWMREPSLKDIPVDKLDFLQKMVFESKTLSQKELMPFSHGSRPEKPFGKHHLHTGGNDGNYRSDKKIQHPRGTDENESDNEADAAP